MLKNATKISLAVLSLSVALNAQAQDKKGDSKAPAATPAAAAAPPAWWIRSGSPAAPPPSR